MYIKLNLYSFLFLGIPEDGVAEESEDEEKHNPDERVPQAVADKRVTGDNEFSESDDEGGRRDQRSFKRKRPRLEAGVPMEADTASSPQPKGWLCTSSYILLL